MLMARSLMSFVVLLGTSAAQTLVQLADAMAGVARDGPVSGYALLSTGFKKIVRVKVKVVVSRLDVVFRSISIPLRL